MRFEVLIIYSIVTLAAKTIGIHNWPRIDLLQKVDPDKEFAHITLIRGAFNNPMYKMREERGYPMSLLSIQELLNDS